MNCVRTNGASCSRMADPSKRAFVTEHGKEMNLNPNEMSLMGGAEGKIVLSDNTGMIISTQKPLSMKGKRISFEAPSVDIRAVGNELILAKAKVDGGGAKTCVSMMHQFDLLSMQHTHLEGWKYQSFDTCKDTIEVVEFDANEVIGNVFAGLAIVAAVVAVVGVVVASGGLAAVGIAASAAGSVAMSAAAVGATAVIGKGISDYQSKEVSSTESYMLTGLLGATAGAVSGGVGVLVEGATPTGLALGAKMGIVGTGGVVETFIEDTIMGRQTTLFDAGFSFVLSASLFGIGDNIGRALKRWRSGAKQADDAIGEVVDQVDNIARDISSQVDNVVEDVMGKADVDNVFDMEFGKYGRYPNNRGNTPLGEIVEYTFDGTADIISSTFDGGEAIIKGESRTLEEVKKRNIIDNMGEIGDDIVNINEKYSDGYQMNNSIENILNSASYYDDPYEQVAAITRSITDHAFANGNKRTAMDTMNMLLDDFGLNNTLTDAQKWDLIYDIAEGRLNNVSEIADILKGN